MSWAITEQWVSCGNERCLKCKAEKNPHGPYYRLVRRHPDTSKVELVYLGSPRVHTWLADPRTRKKVVDHLNDYYHEKPSQESALVIGERMSRGLTVL